MPAAQQCGNRRRLVKAEPRKSAQRFRIILDSGEDEVAGAGKARSVLEELGIVPLDRDEMAKQIGDKRIRLRIAEKDPDSCDPCAVRRKHMRLRVLDHLQAVLETAQEAIIVDQLGSRRRIDTAGGSEATQRLASGSSPQLTHAPTPDQLLGLGEEFDFADAAATGLDVMPLDGDSSAAAKGVDLTLDRVDILNGGKIEVFPPNERLQLAQKALPGDPVAGHRPGLDQRCPFPILADALIVGERGWHRQHQRGGRGVRAQPQICAKDVAVARSFVENAREIACNANKEGLDAITRTNARPGRVVKKDQIDIARIIELVSAELAHAEDDEPAVTLRLVQRRKADRAPVRCLTQQMAHGGPERPLGKSAEGAGLLLER